MLTFGTATVIVLIQVTEFSFAVHLRGNSFWELSQNCEELLLAF